MSNLFKPCDWLDEAVIYNHRFETIPASWFREHADVLVLLFTAKGIDRDGILQKFYRIYENIKFANLPVEVIFISQDNTEQDMIECFTRQANWFALKFTDPLLLKLKYMYMITCLPHLYVINIDGSLVSTHGLMDLEKYGKNAVLSWLGTGAAMKQHRKLARETVYGDKWKFGDEATAKPDYHKKFGNEATAKPDYHKKVGDEAAAKSDYHKVGDKAAAKPDYHKTFGDEAAAKPKDPMDSEDELPPLDSKVNMILI